jgi:type II secretory pathway pseudopilin PulG
MPTGKHRRAAGFTYVGLVVTVAIIGLVAVCSVRLGALLQRRAAEQQLLEIGAEFADALQSYADATPPGKRAQPDTLEELVRDPRFPTPRRHLRRIYLDPLTGRAEWGLLQLDTAPGIVGVYSLAPGRAIKRAQFPAQFSEFNGKLSYRDWEFSADLSRAARARLERLRGQGVSPLELDDRPDTAPPAAAAENGAEPAGISPLGR